MVFKPEINNRSFPRRPHDPSKEFRFVHTPFSLTQVDDDKEKLEAACDKDGRITFTHTIKSTQGEEYEQIVVPASLIFTLVTMLQTTRKTKYQDRKPKENETDGRATQG